MKKTLPYILSFEDLQKQYSTASLYEPQNYFLWREESGLGIDKSSPSYKQSTRGIGEEKQKKVMEVLSKFKKELGEIEDVMLDFVQYQVIHNPQVYIARTRDIKTDIEYFTPKTFFPLKGGKKKEVKIYVGKAKDFNNDTRSKQSLNWARVKMGRTLIRRMNEESL